MEMYSSQGQSRGVRGTAPSSSSAPREISTRREDDIIKSDAGNKSPLEMGRYIHSPPLPSSGPLVHFSQFGPSGRHSPSIHQKFAPPQITPYNLEGPDYNHGNHPLSGPAPGVSDRVVSAQAAPFTSPHPSQCFSSSYRRTTQSYHHPPPSHGQHYAYSAPPSGTALHPGHIYAYHSNQHRAHPSGHYHGQFSGPGNGGGVFQSQQLRTPKSLPLPQEPVRQKRRIIPASSPRKMSNADDYCDGGKCFSSMKILRKTRCNHECASGKPAVTAGIVSVVHKYTPEAVEDMGSFNTDDADAHKIAPICANNGSDIFRKCVSQNDGSSHKNSSSNSSCKSVIDSGNEAGSVVESKTIEICGNDNATMKPTKLTAAENDEDSPTDYYDKSSVSAAAPPSPTTLGRERTASWKRLKEMSPPAIVTPPRSDFYFFAFEREKKYREISKRVVQMAIQKVGGPSGSLSNYQEHKDDNSADGRVGPLDTYLLLSRLNEDLVSAWAAAPLEVRAHCQECEQDDLERYAREIKAAAGEGQKRQQLSPSLGASSQPTRAREQDADVDITWERGHGQNIFQKTVDEQENYQSETDDTHEAGGMRGHPPTYGRSYEQQETSSDKKTQLLM